MEHFATLSWTIADIQTLFDVDYETAQTFLIENQNAIRDRLCELGWDVIKTLGDMEGLKPVEEPSA